MNSTDDSVTNPQTADEHHESFQKSPCDTDAAAQSRFNSLTPLQRQSPGLLQIPALMAIGTVKLYQYLISPWLGRRCRFHPSCSQYFILSVRKFGLIRGLCKGTARICRCHPWNPGGYDPP